MMRGPGARLNAFLGLSGLGFGKMVSEPGRSPQMNDILRRKIRRGTAAGAEGGQRGGAGADHGWRLALARAARDVTGLLVDVADLRLARRSLAELLEFPPDRALIALLDGPGGGLGMIALSPEVTSALVEMQTIGRVAAAAPVPRRPTRTDAAMVSAVIDRALAELEAVLADEADLVWTGGFRYASFLEDARPLGLLLEDQPYRVLTTDLALGDGGRTGKVILALPAEGRGQAPAARPRAAADPGQAAQAAPGTGFSAALGEAVLAADCRLDAVLARVTLPLRSVMALAPDVMIPLTGAALDRIAVTGLDGQGVAMARLGQHRGMRALRLSDAEATGGAAVVPAPDAGAAGPGMPGPDLSPPPWELDGNGGLLATG
jgi:flagellar motor switch protein FliM